MKDRLSPPLIKVFVEIDNEILNAINSTNLPLDITLMDASYGTKSGKLSTPLDGTTASELKNELKYLRVQWRAVNRDKAASYFQDVMHMVGGIFKESILLRTWKINAKYVLIIL